MQIYSRRLGNVYIINPPKNTTAMEGTKARLSCQADGHPNNLTYQLVDVPLSCRAVVSIFVNDFV